jgi:hypothetical protein
VAWWLRLTAHLAEFGNSPEIVKRELEAGSTHPLRGFRKPSQPRSLWAHRTSEAPLASATRISCQSSGVSVSASSGDATLTQRDAFCGSCYLDPGKPPEARALLVSGLSSARINEAGLPSWPESGRKIYDNMKGALACYCLRRAYDETGQRAGLRRHGEPLAVSCA